MLSICPIKESDILLAEIKRENADADFYSALKRKDKNIYAIFNNGNVVGYLQMLGGVNSYVYPFIFPKYRNQGIGSQALQLAEIQLREKNAKMITSCCFSSESGCQKFAKTEGFEFKYSSVYMEYHGPEFQNDNYCLTVRPYRIKDYEKAHDLYAKAFHIMRLGTGWFPESIPEPPSDKMKQYWAESADERFVCLLGDEIIGYAHIVGNEIASISIKKEYQGKGLGRQFVKKAVNLVKSRRAEYVSLYCLTRNQDAYHVYESIGFKPVYYSDYLIKKL